MIDTILEKHPEIIEMVSREITGGQKGNALGRKDMPTVEQIVRAAIYKEINNLTYRELEYQQHDSRLCAVFIKLEERKPFSFKVFQKYISLISEETLNKMLVAINKIAIEEGIEGVISNLKRGSKLYRCEWKTRARFDARVYWNVIVYNIRVMSRALLAKMQTQMQ